MPKNPHADFTPTLAGYSGITPFRFWCQTALPLTYDDSLSYYELLNKVVSYLNHTIEDLTNVENNTSELAEAYEKLQKYVNDYFDDIDLEAELRIVLDGMAEDGTLSALLDPLVANRLPGIVENQIPDVVAEQIDDAVEDQIGGVVGEQLPPLVDANIGEEVTQWLVDNVDPVGSAVIVDSTLTISGAAADAKVTGDKINELKRQLKNNTDTDIITGWVDGYYVMGSAVTNIDKTTPTSSNLYKCVYVDCGPGTIFHYTGKGTSAARPWAFLKANGDIISKAPAGDNNYQYENEKIVVPSGETATVVFNVNKGLDYSVSIGEYISDRIEQLDTDLEALDTKIKDSTSLEPNIIAVNSEVHRQYVGSVGEVLATSSFGNYRGMIPIINGIDNAVLNIAVTGNINADVRRVRKSDNIILEDSGWLTTYTKEMSSDECYAVIFKKVPESGDYIVVDDINDNTSIVITSSVGYVNEKSTKNANDIVVINDELKNITERANLIVACHRGYTGTNNEYPENTLWAYAQAKLRGYKWIENDVRLTSDGVAVLLHDTVINRVARNADGSVIAEDVAIANITYAQALTYDFGIYAGSQFAGTKIVTVDECVKFCKDVGLGIVMEPKVIGAGTICAESVKKYAMEDMVVFQSTGAPELLEVKAVLPKATLGLLRSVWSSDDLTYISTYLKTADNKTYMGGQPGVDISAFKAQMLANDIMYSNGVVNTQAQFDATDPYCFLIVTDKFMADTITAKNTLDQWS